MAFPAGPTRRDARKTSSPPPEPKIHDRFTGTNGRNSRGIAAGKTHVRLGRDGGQFFRTVAKGLRDRLHSRILRGKLALRDRRVLGPHRFKNLFRHEDPS